MASGESPASSDGAQRGMPSSSGSISRWRTCSVGDLADEVRARRGQLVDAVRAVDDERPLRAELDEHLREGRHELGRVDPHDLRARAGRVRQRPEDVEDGPRRELAPDGRRMAHGGVVGRGEQEAEAELVDRALDPLRRELELEAERLEHVGRAGGRRDRAVAVLRHPGAGRRGEERGRGRDVERPRAVAARARRVDEIVALSGARRARALRIASAQPAISSGVSRLIRIATRKAPICAAVASPLMIWSMTARASDRVRSRPSRSRARASWIIRRRLQEAPADLGPERRQDRLGMELDAVDGVLAVPHAPSPRRRRSSRRPRASPGTSCAASE